jgi:hypothetical protein
MKAMMSNKLRNILKDPKRARELQKKLAHSSNYQENEDQREASTSRAHCRSEQSSKHFK